MLNKILSSVILFLFLLHGDKMKGNYKLTEKELVNFVVSFIEMNKEKIKYETKYSIFPTIDEVKKYKLKLTYSKGEDQRWSFGENCVIATIETEKKYIFYRMICGNEYKKIMLDFVVNNDNYNLEFWDFIDY